MLTFGSLFAGIGGMDLGLERAGMKCVWQVEIDPFARRILEKHWPDVRRHDDVRTFPPGDPGSWRCDVIAGGFPCQDISFAGSGRGIEGKRSGLWSEFARILRLLQPGYAILENVSALLVRGLERVLGDLAEMGYDAEWGCLPAAAFGAPHIRDRIFIMAHAPGIGCHEAALVADDRVLGVPARGEPRAGTPQAVLLAHSGACVPIRACPGQPGGDDADHRCGNGGRSRLGGAWPCEPAVDRVADGLPSGLDMHRYGGLGNSIVPQVAEWLGRRLMAFAGKRISRV